MNGLTAEKIAEIEEGSDIRPENKKIIELLYQWANEPEELGNIWWDSFEQELVAFSIFSNFVST
jgi:hypothetical protein